MVNNHDIVFDDNLEFYTSVDGVKNDICIILSDSLAATEEELSEPYKNQISGFINLASGWYEKACLAIKNWTYKQYGFASEKSHIQLLNIFILFEQGESELYGLQFAIDCDVEHGCGLKMNNNGFQIIEIGNADIAFC